ncbi:MAG TPA: hypothetical protein VH306_00430 [Gaiellaceae bacterium]
MTAAFEIVFAVGLAIVALSFAAVVLERGSDSLFVAAAIVLTLGAIACGIVFGLNLSRNWAPDAPILLATGGLLAAAVAEIGLVLLRRGLRRLKDYEAAAELGRQRIAAYLEEQSRERAAEQEVVLARERATASHLLGEQERKLTIERRDLVARQTDQARAELTEAVARVQERLERRLSAWAADLDRGQRALETRLTELGQRQAEAASSQESRLAADTEQLESAAEQQRAMLQQLREDVRSAAKEVIEEGRNELDVHAAERRRAMTELSDQLREREQGLRDDLQRDVSELQERLIQEFAEVSRRQMANLERSLDRAVGRLSEDAERRFDAQIRQSREKAAERLSHELDRTIEQFAQRAEKDVADRIGEAARQTAERLQKRTDDLARAAESQSETSEARLRTVSDRLDSALASAEQRIAAFQAQIEEEIETRIGELERSLRAPQG